MIKFKVPVLNSLLVNTEEEPKDNVCYHICSECKNNVKDVWGFEKYCLKNARLKGETITKCNLFRA